MALPLLVRVMVNFIMPSYCPMQEDVVLNSTANMGAPSCAYRPDDHYPLTSLLPRLSLAESAAVESLNIDINVNALSQIFVLFRVRE